MDERMAGGDEAFQRHLADGHVDTYLADIAHATAHAAEFGQALLVPINGAPAARA